MTETALIIGYSVLIVYLFYLSYDLLGKPKNTIEKSVLKWLQPQTIGIFVRLLAMWSIVGLTAFLAIIAQAGAYESFFNAIFISSIYVTFAITLIYLALYFTFTITTKLEEASKWRYK